MNVDLADAATRRVLRESFEAVQAMATRAWREESDIAILLIEDGPAVVVGWRTRREMRRAADTMGLPERVKRRLDGPAGASALWCVVLAELDAEEMAVAAVRVRYVEITGKGGVA